jgi:hypothetical protein
MVGEGMMKAHVAGRMLDNRGGEGLVVRAKDRNDEDVKGNSAERIGSESVKKNILDSFPAICKPAIASAILS